MARQSAKVSDVLTAEQIKTEHDGTVEGYYVQRQDNQGRDNNSTIYTLQQKDGERISLWGSGILDEQFDVIGLNTYVWVDYKGKEKSKKTGREYHMWGVDFDPEDVLGTGTVKQSPANTVAKGATSNVANPPVADQEDGDQDLPF